MASGEAAIIEDCDVSSSKSHFSELLIVATGR
jgi:hypothetical protein